MPIRIIPVDGKRVETLGNPRVPPDKSVISFNLHAATFVKMGLGIVKLVVVAVVVVAVVVVAVVVVVVGVGFVNAMTHRKPRTDFLH